MTKEVTFSNITHTQVNDYFLNALQEMLSGFVMNGRLVAGSTTSVTFTGSSSGNSQTGITVAGKMAYSSGPVSLALTGAAATYDIFVLLNQSDTSNVDRGFTLVQVASGGTPVGGSGMYRKVGTVPWNGTIISGDVINLGDTAPTHSPVLTGTPVVPTAAAGTNTTQAASTAFVQAAVLAALPVGSIIMWPFSTPPTGWKIIDGTAVTTAISTALRTALLADASKFGVSGSDPLLPNMNGRVPVGVGTGAGNGSSGTSGSAPSGTALTARSLGAWSGAETVTLTTAMIPPHLHTGSVAIAGAFTGASTVAHSHGIGGGIGNVNAGTFMTAIVTNAGGGFGAQQASTAVGNLLSDPGHGHAGSTITMNTDGGSGGSHTNLEPQLALNFIIKIQ